jgi:hypothetical protein
LEQNQAGYPVSNRPGQALAVLDGARVRLARSELRANGGGLSAAPIIYTQSSTARVDMDGVLLLGNRARTGPLVVYAAGSMTDCVAAGNRCGPVLLSGAGSPAIRNSTLYGTGAAQHFGAAHLTNCIYWNFAPPKLDPNDPLQFSYCLVPSAALGPGNLVATPQWVRWPDDGGDGFTDDPNTPDIDEGANDDFGDLRLLAASPGIDAGANLLPARDLLDVDGDGCRTEAAPCDASGAPRYQDVVDVPDIGAGAAPLVDMGAYEHPGNLSPGPATCPADANCDGRIDFDDIDPFVLALGGASGYAQAYPGCLWLNADTNNDGDVTFDDIDPFVELLAAPQIP